MANGVRPMILRGPRHPPAYLQTAIPTLSSDHRTFPGMTVRSRPTTTNQPSTQQCFVTPLLASDLNEVIHLLALLDESYPGGGQWLESRLRDALRGRARCLLLRSKRRVLGAAVDTPKGRHR